MQNVYKHVLLIQHQLTLFILYTCMGITYAYICVRVCVFVYKFPYLLQGTR